MADTGLKSTDANSRQIMLVAGGALLAALFLFAIWYLVIRTPYAPAFTELKSADASLIIEELERQKTPYELTDNATTIMVPEDQVDASRVNILGGDLPLKGTVGFELFNQSDMGLTEFAQKINYQRALQGELARTLMSLENIETARVHLSLPDSGIFERDKRAAKASVTIAPKLGKSVDGTTVTGIQRLIASAVSDLDTSNVAVLDAEGQLLSQELLPADELGGSTGSPLEQQYAARVRGAISPMISDPNVRVTVRMVQDLVKSRDLVAPASTADSETMAPATTEGDAGRDPIRISIIFSETPDVQTRDNLIPLLEQSIDYNPARGDSLMILTSPVSLPPLSTSAARGAKSVASDEAAWDARDGLFWSNWLWLLLALIFVPLLFLALRKTSLQREMTMAQRETFSERLKALVDEQGGRGRGTL